MALSLPPSTHSGADKYRIRTDVDSSRRVTGCTLDESPCRRKHRQLWKSVEEKAVSHIVIAPYSPYREAGALFWPACIGPAED
jgi:hypothetical protein